MVLIKSAKIVDGSGIKQPYVADVLLSDGKISAIGKFPQKKAEIVIDGLGLYLAPGFIDVDTDSDHHLTLFTNPIQQDFLLQGVTTIFGGFCGSSLAPLIYGNLKSIRKWTDTSQINVNWRSVGEFLKVLEQFKMGVNFGTLVGHSTVRRGLVGEDFRDLTVPELEAFKKLLKDSMSEGAFGMSTGLGYAHAKQVPYLEIKELARIIAKKGGIYATHLRNEREGLLASVEETIRLAEETGVKILISHFKPIIGYDQDYRKAVELIHQVSAEHDIHFDNYPYDESVVPIYTLLPHWAQVGNLEIMLSYINNSDTRERIINELSELNGNYVRIAQATAREYLIGKTLAEFASNQELSVPEALIKLMSLTEMRALIFYRNINFDLVAHNLERDQVFIASNGASLPPDTKLLKHERFYNTFPRFLELVLQRKTLSLPEAIRKITSDPAKKFGLNKRGLIKEDNFGDLTLFSLKSGAIKIEHTIVNGKLAVKDGQIQNNFGGVVLRSGS